MVRRKKTKVVVQKWEEVEVGWSRKPDGYSIHLTEEDRLAASSLKSKT
jgi:hypothetical protein